MKTKRVDFIILSMLMMFIYVPGKDLFGQPVEQPDYIQLEQPDCTGGMPLMQALKERKTNRSIADAPLSHSRLSGILWAANGQNRDDGKRTAPSAMNKQMIGVFVVLKEGVYLYQPELHRLALKVAGDYRKLAGSQPFVAIAPVNLIFVADFSRWKGDGLQPSKEELVNFAGIEAGCQAQNVYLYGASEGLAVVVRGSVSREEVTQLLGLTPDQYIVCAQTVGLPQ